MARKPYSEPVLRIKPNTVECKCNMVMGIDTIQCKPCLAKGLELRVDLNTQLTAGAGEKVLYASANKIAGKPAVRIRERWNLVIGRHGLTPVPPPHAHQV